MQRELRGKNKLMKKEEKKSEKQIKIKKIKNK